MRENCEPDKKVERRLFTTGNIPDFPFKCDPNILTKYPPIKSEKASFPRFNCVRYKKDTSVPEQKESHEAHETAMPE